MIKSFLENTTVTERLLIVTNLLSLGLFWATVLTNHSLWGMTK